MINLNSDFYSAVTNALRLVAQNASVSTGDSCSDFSDPAMGGDPDGSATEAFNGTEPNIPARAISRNEALDFSLGEKRLFAEMGKGRADYFSEASAEYTYGMNYLLYLTAVLDTVLALGERGGR